MFETKGDRPQWAMIYDRLAGMQIGDIVKYSELCELLDVEDIERARVPFWRAVKQIEDDRHRTFDNVRTVGYRMVQASEHEGLARRQHRKAKRRLRAAIQKAVCVDVTLLTPEQRRSINQVADHLAGMIRRLDGRMKTETRERKQGEAHLSERLDRLSALLEKHGIRDEQTAATP